MSSVQELQVMALAGLSKALLLVQEVATKGTCNKQEFEACLHSVLITNPERPEDVFNYSEPKADLETVAENTDVNEESGDNYQQLLEPGYRHIYNQLHNAQNKNLNLTRYNIGIITLERKLAKRQDLLAMMGERIGQVKRQLHHFELGDEQVIANFASIYSEIISPIGPKIQIQGETSHLQQVHVQNKIRALLLAAMRACVLWRQLGGKRRQFLFNRKQIIGIAKQQLNTI